MTDPFKAWKKAVLEHGMCAIDPRKHHEHCPWPLDKPVPEHLWDHMLFEIGMTMETPDTE